MAVYRAASDAGAVLLPLALGILAWSLSGRFATGIAAAWIGGLWGGLAGYAWLLSDAIPALLGGRPPPMLETDYYEPRFLGEYVGPHSEITAYLNGPAFYPRDMGLVPSWLALAVLMAPLRNRWRLLGVLLLGGAATAIYPYYGSSALILFAAAGAGAAGNLDPRRRRLAAAAAAVGLVLAALALVVLADTFISNYLEPAGLRAYLAGLAGGSTTVPTAPVLEFQLARVASGHFFMICAIGWMVWTRQADAAQPLWQRRWLRRLFVFGIAAAGASGLAASLDATAWRVLSVYRWVVPWRTLVEPLLVVLTALAVERLVTRLWSRSRRAAAIALLAAPCFSPLHWNANAWRFWESGIRGGNTRERLAKYEEFADAGARVLGRTRFREPLLLEGASVATGDYVQAALGVTTVNNRSRALVPEGQPRLLHLLAPHAEPALRAASASGQIGDVMAATDGELARRLRASPDWCEVAGFGRFVVLRPTSVCAP
jgi:hypothetical protein